MWASLDKGLGAVGQAADRVVSYAQKAAQKTANEAKALTVAEASLKAEDGWAAVDLEHQKLKGANASAARESAYKALDDVRKKTAEGIADPTARNEYLTRSAARLADYHRRIDTHTLREYDKARDETLNARMKQALGATAAGDPGKDKLASEVEDEIKATHPDASGPLIALFRSNMAFEMVKKAASDNIEGAEQYLQTRFGRESLGQHYSEAVEMVKKAKGIAEKTTAKLEAESLAAEVLKQATGPDGKLDEGKAKAGISEVPEASRIYARTIINERIAADAMQRKAEFDGLKNEARKQLNHGKVFGSIDPKLLSTLESLPGGAEYVKKLQNDAETDARRREIRARGTPGQKSALAKEQANADKIATNRFKRLLIDDPNTDVEDFVVGKGVSEVAKSGLELLGRQAQERASKGESSDHDAFTRLAIKEAGDKGITPKGKARGMSEEKQDEFAAEAQAAYEAWVVKHGKPSLTEKQQILDPLLADVVKRNAYWFDSKEKGFEALARERKANPQPQQAPTAKAATPPAGDPLVRVRAKKTGAVGKVPRSKFNPALYEELPQ